jgi:hypothetical protein
MKCCLLRELDSERKAVELSEEEMKALGFRQFRTLFQGMADRLTGYKYVALDREGHRQGSLNEVLPSDGT